MHRREKSAIQTHRKEIVDDLFLEEDLLAKMMREKLFTTGMIEDIKSQKTLRDKNHRLLEILLKRGPEAFPKFIAILREDYKWLAENLEKTYIEKLQLGEEIDSARTPRQLKLSFPPTPCETLPKRSVSTRQISRGVQESYSRGQTMFFSENLVHEDEADGQITDLIYNRQTGLAEADMETRLVSDACVSPIQTLTPSRRYIHTASSPFPSDRRSSHIDHLDNGNESEEDIVESDDEVFHQDPNVTESIDEADAQTVQSIDELEIVDNDTDINETDEDKILEELYLKLHKINTENDLDTDIPSEEGTGHITLAMVHEEIDKLVRRTDNAETSLDQVSKSLGENDPKVPVELQIQQLMESKDELRQQLEKEKREKESMVNDMYYISREMKHINNLKQKNASYEKENRELKEQLERTTQEGEKKIEELNNRLREVTRDKERAEVLLLQPLQQPQQSKGRRTRSFLGASRRTTPVNLHHTSSFDFGSTRAKFSIRKK